ncbi:hypothetical protein ILUMI_25551 [Ignelater luminosus]|uniref:Uncharacterized protein n=1 Tax=Ignelater luminosus TaxID=2038154 RepID=A0A8K0C874_IGNLU|nr:hypothetical protein ILUMI_25551 [Ignelater luminosus]
MRCSNKPKFMEIIIKQYRNSKTIREIAENLNVSTSIVFNIIKHYGETENVGVKGRSSGHPRLVAPTHQRLLVKLCKKGRRNELRDVIAQWNGEFGLKLSQECCRKWIENPD